MLTLMVGGGRREKGDGEKAEKVSFDTPNTVASSALRSSDSAPSRFLVGANPSRMFDCQDPSSTLEKGYSGAALPSTAFSFFSM